MAGLWDLMTVTDDELQERVNVSLVVTEMTGIAQLLRSGEPITKRAIASVILNSGLFGVAVAALMIDQVGIDSWALIVGISVLSGLGGNALIEMAIAILKKSFREKIE